MKVEIRKYQESDKNTIVGLLIDFQQYLADIDSKKVVTPYENSDEAEILVALVSNRIVGFVQYTIDRHEGDDAYNLMHAAGDHGWITELFVDEKFRGQGIARLLVSKAEEYFRKNNCVNSRINVMFENKSAISAYYKLGYEDRDIELSKDL